MQKNEINASNVNSNDDTGSQSEEDEKLRKENQDLDDKKISEYGQTVLERRSS